MDDADSSAADALIMMVPTPARKKAAREDALSKALNLGEYPEYRGLHGVVDELDISLKLLWPDTLMLHVAHQTNLYARNCNVGNWVETVVFFLFLFLAQLNYFPICSESPPSQYPKDLYCTL